MRSEPTRDGPLLEARGVSKRFGGVQALQRVSFELRPGEVLALAGDNGRRRRIAPGFRRCGGDYRDGCPSGSIVDCAEAPAIDQGGEP